MKISSAFALSLGALALPACVDSDAADPGLLEPGWDGKADGLGPAIDAGHLEFGGEARGTFDEDFQFFAYTFDARQNANLDVEVTRLGSSQGLDTTLFLYRIDTGGEPRRIAVDDDAGFGALSRIEDFRLFADGRYVVVVGTKEAQGRGNYRLALTCNSGECGPVVPPEDACPSAMQKAIAECLQEASHESDFEADFRTLAAETCGTAQELEFTRENECSGLSAPWCEGPETIQACDAFIVESYPSAERAQGLLTRAPNSPALEAVEQAAFDSEFCGELGEDAGCEFFVHMFTHDPQELLTPQELLAHARTLATPGPGVHPEQDTDRDAREGLGGFADFFEIRPATDALVASLGLDLDDAELATASGPEFQFQFGDCEGALVVVHFPSEGIVLDFVTLTCAG